MASSIQISDERAALPGDLPEAAVAASDRGTTAQDLAKSDLWIFREGRQTFSGRTFLYELQQRIAARDSLLDSLIQAGELEAALADADTPGAETTAALTDALASQLWTEHRTCVDSGAEEAPVKLAGQIEVPETISISPPEGFTYYALHPLDFANTAEKIFQERVPYAVIGIRSIGTTLSAVVTAVLRGMGHAASRITVRPKGHPYSRKTEFSPEEERWISLQLSQGARFVIVDEGPGRSGSTFVSVAEALARAAVTPDHMTILGSRPFSPEQLCAENAAERWKKFRFVTASASLSRRFANWHYIGGGDWRKHFYSSEQEWPESWTQMERFKVLSPDRREFVKFEGMGRIGRQARQRAFALAEANWSPAVSDTEDGFLSYGAVNGCPMRKQDVTPEILQRIALYCAFRATEFQQSEWNSSELEHMLVFNVQQEFGRELKLAEGILGDTEAVLVDGRMHPHEWIVTPGNRILKTDSISHGDNHFFPGPCSIAWDLAGAAIEWDLGNDETEFLLTRFRQCSGIDVSKEFETYLLAYCVFRMGFCKMARVTVLGSPEEERIGCAYLRYRNRAIELLDSLKNFQVPAGHLANA